MTVANRIFRRVRSLPGHLQSEVLQFVDYVIARSQIENRSSEDDEWEEFSLSEALRGLDEDSEPEYSESDIKVRFE